MPSAFKSIGDAEYAAEVLRSDRPTIVFFWHPWSDPCRYFIPALEGFAAQHAQDAKLVKVNVQEHQAAAKEARIAALPALLLYQGGQVVADILGTCTEPELAALFQKARELGQKKGT